jgi:hypothetical protein
MDEDKIILGYPFIHHITGEEEPRINFDEVFSDIILKMIGNKKLCCVISQRNIIETIDLVPNQSFYKNLQSNRNCNLMAYKKHGNIWILKAMPVALEDKKGGN